MRDIEINQKDVPGKIMQSCVFIKWLLAVYNNLMNKIVRYQKTSLIINYYFIFKNRISIVPIKIVSVIIVASVFINIVLCFVFKVTDCNQFWLLSWIIKGMLLCIGLAGLLCKAELRNVLRESTVIKLISYKSN